MLGTLAQFARQVRRPALATVAAAAMVLPALSTSSFARGPDGISDVAERVIDARRQGWQWEVDDKGTRRTMGFASLGGATLDNEENYLIKKLFTALGAIQIENQARI